MSVRDAAPASIISSFLLLGAAVVCAEFVSRAWSLRGLSISSFFFPEISLFSLMHVYRAQLVPREMLLGVCE